MADADATSPEKRTHTVSVRVNPAEFAAWEAATLAASRRQIGAWVREVAVAGYLAGPRTSNPREVDPAVAGLRAELARLGNNVNQIAHALNTPGHAHADAAVAAAEPHLAAITTTLAELYGAIERAETRAR